MVTTPGPGALIGCGEQGLDFRSRQESDLRAGAALARNGEDALNLGRVGRRLEGCVAEEGANSGEPQVSGTRRNAATLLQVMEKCGNQRRVKLIEGQREGVWPSLAFAKRSRRRKVSRYEPIVCGLTRRCCISRCVKKCCSNAGKLGGGSWSFLPALFESRHRLAHQFRTGTEIPVRIGDMDVSEVGREYGQASLDFRAGAIPSQQRLDGESMTEVV